MRIELVRVAHPKNKQVERVLALRCHSRGFTLHGYHATKGKLPSACDHQRWMLAKAADEGMERAELHIPYQAAFFLGNNIKRFPRYAVERRIRDVVFGLRRLATISKKQF